MGANEVLIAEDASFLRDSIDLKALHSALKKAGKPAVDLLLETLENEKLDLKVRLDAAKTILNFQVTVAKTIAEDQMSRFIAEIKLLRKPQGTIEDKPDAPLVDFSTVRGVD